MHHEEAESSTSARRKEVERVALLDSPVFVARKIANYSRESANDPPPYGAQHRQDALWEGGNDALPPLWQQFQVLDHKMLYQDNNLIMGSGNRPLPGVQLDHPGDLIPGCEWHVSPHGRSYFVNHNTRTTSWKKPVPERPAGSLTPECIIEGRSQCIWDVACLGTSCNIMSSSSDGSIRQWTRDGKPVGKPWVTSDGGVVASIGVSPDETMVVSGCADGRVQLWNIKEGSTVGKPWEGHTDAVMCLDWSPDAVEIASGSDDGTIRRWNPDTGQQTAPLIKTRHGWVYVVKYSPQGDEFASGGADKIIRVWSKKGKLLIEIKGHESTVTSLCWSKDGARIFSASSDYTIRTWQSFDGKELAVLRGHTKAVTSLRLTPDERYLVSASRDCSVRIWDLKINQPVGDPLFHDGELLALAMSPDGKYVVSAQLYAQVYVWSLEAALKQKAGDQVGDGNTEPDSKLKGRAAPPRDIFDVHFVPKRQANNGGVAKYGKDFFGDATDRAPRRSAPLARSSSPLQWRNLFSFLRPSTRPADAPQPTLPQSRRWNFTLSPVRTSSSVVAAAREDDRIGIAPPSEAEVAAAMRCPRDNIANNSTQQAQAASGAQGSQVYMQGATQLTPGQSVPQSIPLQPRRRNPTLSPERTSRHLVIVTASRDEDRIGIAPPSEAEVAAAMQRTNDDDANISLQQGQAAAEAQRSQPQVYRQGPTQTTQRRKYAASTESYETRCCGFCRRTSH